MVAEPEALSQGFAAEEGKAQQWRGFLKRARVAEPGTLEDVIGAVFRFVGPPLTALAEGREF